MRYTSGMSHNSTDQKGDGANSAQPRSGQLEKLFPQGVPGLWAELFTHFTRDGEIDWPRMDAHFKFVRGHVNAFVIAGNASQYEHLDENQVRQLIDWIVQKHRPGKEFILRGPCSESAPGDDQALAGCLYDADSDALAQALASGHAVGVRLKTSDEDDPRTERIVRQAQEHENLLYIVDSSGDDQLAKHPDLPRGVIRFEGCDTQYAKALASSGGPYHGLMVTAASLFPSQMAQIVLLPGLGQWDDAHKLAEKIGSFIRHANEMTDDYVSQGSIDQCDADISACKATDHFMAHGPLAKNLLPPMIWDHYMIPDPYIAMIGRLLSEHQLMPERGYLESTGP